MIHGPVRRRQLRILVSVFLILVTGSGAAPAVYAQTDEDLPVIQVYILLNSTASAAWTERFTHEFLSASLDVADYRIRVIQMHLDLPLGDEDPEPILSYIRWQFEKSPPDVIIPVFSSMSEFVNDHAGIFSGASPAEIPGEQPGSPSILFLGPDRQLIPRLENMPNAKVFPAARPQAIRETFDVIFQLLPETGKIVVISGAEDSSRRIADDIMMIFRNRYPQIASENWVGLSENEMYGRITRQPRGTVLFYNSMISDSYGNRYINFHLINRISEFSPFPVFSYYDGVFGRGIVGGQMVSADLTAAKLLDAVLDMGSDHADQPPPDAHIRNGYLSGIVLDQRQLRRWSIPRHRIPSDALIMYREDNILRDYRYEVLGASGVFIILLVSAMGLFFNRRRLQITKDSLEAALSQLKSISKSLTGGMVFQLISDESGHMQVTFVSDSVHELYNFGLKELRERPELMYENIHPDDLPGLLQAEKAAARDMKVMTCEIRIRNPDGSYRWSALVSTPTRLTDGRIRWDGLEFIITQRKQTEEALSRSLEEKNVLIRELYHRTKNTLQQIRSLITLQAETYPDNDDLKSMVKETETRIQSIALVQQMLYSSGDLSHVSAREYIPELCKTVLRSYSEQAARITLELELEDVRFLFDELIPLGLIINELLTNACKYAFPLPEGKAAAAAGQGIVQVKLQHLDERTVLIRVKDNGAGVESGFSLLGNAGLGLALVQSIGEGQLGGTIAYESSEGFGVSIEFPINSYETRV
ncbi:histidine kinase dimerization/phosphoacceptor domain -containing protein [Salinispira pacifica]|uniref:histidine kinase n=1 Tax=Salinispira pacifica TaxID=1307761 RepID=V5WJX7_9SPIO|nr:histidine kinase dimerization/phosphoacceptor domain -containing protein [Salinispira pacifica]AHC15894.1 hypothetical protein L21SP2_2542 [Salinispira pacifica]